jgi:maleate cis-trans isomerase
MSDQEQRWKRDGWEASVRIGVLTPHADVGPESELQAMAPQGVAIHATRVPFGAMAAEGAMDPTIPLAPVRAFAEPPHLDDAAELLAAAPLKAITYGFTPSDLHAWVSEQVSTTDAEAIVYGGNGFRTVGAIAALEEELGRAVVTPNQALLWAALRVADADVDSVRDYGRLFSHS